MPFWYNNQKTINPSEFMTPDTFLENIYPSPTEIHWWCICYNNPVTHKPHRHPINTGTHTHTLSTNTGFCNTFLEEVPHFSLLSSQVENHFKHPPEMHIWHFQKASFQHKMNIQSYSQKRVPAFLSPTSLLVMLGRLWHLGPLCTSGAQTEANVGPVVYQSSFYTGVLTHPQKQVRKSKSSACLNVLNLGAFNFISRIMIPMGSHSPLPPC